MELKKAKQELKLAEKHYHKKLNVFKELYWERLLELGGVTTLDKFNYARPMVTFNGKWDKEKFIELNKPLQTKYVRVNNKIYYAHLYSVNVSRDFYSYELYGKHEHLYNEVAKELKNEKI